VFDIFYVGENKKLKDVLPFAKQVESYEQISPKTKMYWLVEPNIEVIDTQVFEFRPADHDQMYEHVWKWSSKNYGGVKLLPKTSSKGIKEINRVVCRKSFDILFTPTPETYFNQQPYATHVWCVDSEYKLNKDIDWAPDNFEPTFIHSFHLRGQLEHKYPEKEGGIKLYPRSWRETQTKYHTFLDANIEYPVLRVTDVNDYKQRDKFKDEYVWLIDRDHKINNDTLDWVPNPFEEMFIHCFRMPYQLTEKYPMAMGGIRLVPKDWQNAPIKIHPACPVSDEEYDVFFIDSDDFNEETYTEYSERSKTEWFWIIDREFTFNGKLLYVPASHEQEYIHVFKIPGHLDFRYPIEVDQPWDNRCGGVRLVNKAFDMTKHKYQPKVVPVRFDIFYTPNITAFDIYARKSRTKMFWLIDSDYQISNELNYVPPNDEQKYLLNFQVNDQLRHKYPDKEGGVYLVPKNINEHTVTKYKGALNIHKKEYPIVYVDDVTDLSGVTEDCWLIDREYQIDHDINWIPSNFEKTVIHTFHVPNQLKHKYPQAMGGVRWVPLVWDNNYKIHEDLPVKAKTYPVYYVEDVNDYSQAKGECWLVDKEYILDQDIEWIPSNFERKFIHAFQVEGQLAHKYPEAMGGVRWIPIKWEEAEVKIHTETPFKKPTFDKFTTEEEGRTNTTKDWFWVIDPNVEILSNFDFSYVPTIWDAGKAHVWQKLNPVTGRQYDYAGVMLCPKTPQAKGRPKYIREAACTQKEFPILHLDPALDIIEQLTHIDNAIENSMYWVVDPFTRINPDFKFDYYPTQWDQQNVHVFADEDGAYRNIRLYPKGTFSNNALTDKDVSNNSFNKLKQINTIGSLRPQWPVVHLKDVTKSELVTALQEFANQEVPFLWTVDPDVSVEQSVLDAGYLPDILSINKIHVWQRQNPHTQKVHSYGGLRLWPTQKDYSQLTTDSIRLNKLKDIQYVKEMGSTYKPYDIVFLSYKEQGSSNAYKRLTARFPATWVKDIAGIFNAHKEAARSVKSKMFWVVDADAEILDTFDFGYVPDVYDQEVVHVWASKNPITGMEYGYGGVKLFNREQILNATSWGLDFTTGLSTRFKAMPEVSCVTRFNTDAYSTWRSAFRECVKLALKDDAESIERLDGWLHPVPDAFFRHDAKRGAEEGRAYALANRNDIEALARINDYEWLGNRYNQQ
jgi:hypothetical protein